MDVTRGLKKLESAIGLENVDKKTDEYLNFLGWQRQLLLIVESTRRYSISPPSEIYRQEDIMRNLDRLALRYFGVSFYDLCVLDDKSLIGVDNKNSKNLSSIFSGIRNDAQSSSSPVINSGNTWAVLVGINVYGDCHISNLGVCVADVTAIQQSLGATSGTARLLTDDTVERPPTRANILGELSTVTQLAQDGDLLLFYFSGHGIAEAGESYLLPRDAHIAALKHTGISMRSVREFMDASAARAKVIILDACHSGASFGKAETVMTEEFIRRVFEEAEGMVVLASCKQGQKSWPWPAEGRSVFTYYLLEALAGRADFDNKGFVTVSDVNRYVSDGVRRWAAEHGVPQTPTLQSSVAGDIVLVRYT